MVYPVYSECKRPYQTAYTHRGTYYMANSPGKNNYSFKCMFPVKQITYPKPPYMIVRENVLGVTFPVKSRKLMDMIKKFDPNDTSYIDYESAKLLPDSESPITSIRDRSNKAFVLQGDTVWAKFMQGSNQQAKFIITIYRGRATTKTPVTVKVPNTDLYLSYQPKKARFLKVLSLQQRTLDFTNPDTSHYFFFLTPTGNGTYCFESVAEPGSFISTLIQGNGRATVQPISEQNTHHMDFVFDQAIDILNKFEFARPEIQKPSVNYSFNERILQKRYQSILPQEDFIMYSTAMTSMPESSYTWLGQGNFCQRNYMGPQLT